MGDYVEARKIINRKNVENIAISEKLSVAKGLYFELTEPLNIPGVKKSTSKLELRFDGNDKNKLIAFVIWVSGANLQDNTSAYQTAYRFTNFLTLKTGKFVFHKRPREIVNGEVGKILRSITVDEITNNLVNLDTNSTMNSLYSVDPILNLKLGHFCNGTKALDDLNFIEAIREFYLVIEDEIPDLEAKYKPLRNGVSHVNPKSLSTLNGLEENFGISCKLDSKTNEEYVDMHDPYVMAIIEKEARSQGYTVKLPGQ